MFLDEDDDRDVRLDSVRVVPCTDKANRTLYYILCTLLVCLGLRCAEGSGIASRGGVFIVVVDVSLSCLCRHRTAGSGDGWSREGHGVENAVLQ